MIREELKFTTKGSIALGLAGEAMLTGIIAGYLVYFGTDILGLSSVVMGNLLLISQVLGGIMDLAFGVLIENTQTKAGKARPWILRMCIPFALCCILIFCIPAGWSWRAKLIGLFAGYNLYVVTFTGLSIATNSLTALICLDGKNRLTLSSIMVGSVVAGNMVINAIAVPALSFFSASSDGAFTQSGFARLTAILAVISVIGGILTYVCTAEITQTERKKENHPLKGIGALLKNKYWMLQTGNGLSHYFALYCRLTTMVYYAQYVVQDMGSIPILVLADQLPSLLAMPFAAKLCGRYGKRNCTMAGCLLSTVFRVIMLFSIHNFPFFVAATVLKSVTYAPYQCTYNAMIADTAAYGNRKYHYQVDVLAYSVSSFTTKVGQGLSGALVGYVLAFTGYAASASAQTISAQNGIIFLFLGISVIAGVLQVICMLFYDLDKKMPYQ